MPRQRAYYDPIVQTSPPEPEPVAPVTLAGFPVQSPGLYVRLADVVAYLMHVAAAFDTDGGRGAVLDVANALELSQEPFSALLPLAEAESDPTPAPELPAPEIAAESVREGLTRVEVYPDADGKWHSRAVDAAGVIREDGPGSFNREQVVRLATERWPGLEVFELPDGMGDSVWDEQHHSFGWNGRRRPSPNRLFAGLG